MSTERLSVLREAWLILVLAAGFGAALAAVQTGLGERIEANKRAQTLSQVPALVLGSELTRDATIAIRDGRIEVRRAGGEAQILEVVERQIAGHLVLEVRRSTDELAGWVLWGADQGYADQIELLVGLSPDGAVIRGLYVLSQKETPALGDGITREEFRQRFVGRRTDRRLQVTRVAEEASATDGGILALTAATISSRSVCDIVNRTVAEVKPRLPIEEDSRSR
ncbi:MAG: FMN-binding protein [bacterium]|nr:FMN-binding protein [bacterium]